MLGQSSTGLQLARPHQSPTARWTVEEERTLRGWGRHPSGRRADSVRERGREGGERQRVISLEESPDASAPTAVTVGVSSTCHIVAPPLMERSYLSIPNP